MKHTATRLGTASAAIGMATALIVSSVASAAPKTPNHFQGQTSSSFSTGSSQQGNQGSGNPFTSTGSMSMTTGNQQGKGNGNSQGNGVGKGSKGNTNKQTIHIQLGNILSTFGIGSGGSITLNSKAISLLKGVVASIKSNWPTTNSDPTWTPSGANWQFNWKNWNPALWAANGSSFDNWSSQLDSFVGSMFPSLGSQLTMIGL